jgi:hypothetical protein
MRQLLASAPDPALRELYKDLLINQSFRRDVYVRGAAPIWSGELLERIGQCPLTLLQPPAEIELKFKTSFGEVTGNADVYRPIIEQLGEHTLTLGELHQRLPSLGLPNLLQSISLLAHAGALAFAVPQVKPRAAQQFNQCLAQAVSQGAPYGAAALPGIGSGLPLNDIQWMALDAQLQGAKTPEALIQGVATRLQRLNKSLLKDGQPLPPGDALNAELQARLTAFNTQTLPLLRRLGGVK